MHPYYYQGNMMGWGAGGMIIGAIMFVIVLTCIIWFIRMAMWRGGMGYARHHHLHDIEQKSSGTEQSSKASDILKERFARGEITKEQFEEMRKTLES
jgi:putative membrane protein